MKVCIIPTCSNTKKLTSEKIFFKVPVEKKMRKRWCRQVKVDSDFPKTALVCEDHFNFEKDVENYMRVRLMNAKPVLKKDAVPSRFLGSKQEASTQRHQGLQALGPMDSNVQVSPKNKVQANFRKKVTRSCNQKEEKQFGASYSCMLCQHIFFSQVSLAAHFSSCIMHLGFEHTSSVSNTMDKCSEYNLKQEKKDEKLIFTSSLQKLELPVLHYCRMCFAEFDEKCAWESHLAKCERHPKQKTKDHYSSGATFTKDPPKDVLHEKVIEDEAWLVTSLPQGYECVDAMFVVEAEGTCMLQQEIPVEPEEEQFQYLEEQKEQEVCVPEEEREEEEEDEDEGISPLEKDFLPPWCLSLLPGGLEAEEEKEMMEQKLVLEPRFMQRAFVCVRGRPPEDYEEQEEEILQDPLAPTEVLEVKKEPREEVVDEDFSTNKDFIHVKIEHQAENEGNEDNLEERGVNAQVVPDSPTACLEQLRVVDTQVACH